MRLAADAMVSGVRIVIDDLSGPEIAELVREHIEEMRSISPPESKHALALDGLRAPNVTVWSAWDGDTVAGCCALKALDAEHAEIKSMRTATAYQRRGVATLLLTHVLGAAAERGIRCLSLETGSRDFFRPARELYAGFGFEYCPPFADYRHDPLSVFMTKVL
jgi:putative acetyltransferase